MKKQKGAYNTMLKKPVLIPLFSAVVSSCLWISALASADQKLTQVQAEKDVELKGIISSVQPDQFLLTDSSNRTYLVTLTTETEIEEQKINFFRGPRVFSRDDLIPGLRVNVDGEGGDSGQLVASEIKFKYDDLKVARSILTSVSRVDGAVHRLDQDLERTEGNLQGLESSSRAFQDSARGDLDELASVYQAVRQKTDRARREIATLRTSLDQTEERISNLDRFEEVGAATLQFDVNSSRLSESAQGALDQVAGRLKGLRGYLLEVAGFASSDGSYAYNLRLSQARADSAIRYLNQQHHVPLHRVVTPLGLGENSPIGDNTTQEGRVQNRRVEIRILVSRGQQASPLSQ